MTSVSSEFLTRFESRIDKQPNGCWLWTAGKDRYGYGSISFGGRSVKAHRLAFFIEHDRWPTPCALHRCNVPACVRVGTGHIYEGTPANNTLDMMRSNRHGKMALYGQANPATKVNADIVRIIRSLWENGDSASEIAFAARISKSQVLNIVNGRHWRSI